MALGCTLCAPTADDVAPNDLAHTHRRMPAEPLYQPSCWTRDAGPASPSVRETGPGYSRVPSSSSSCASCSRGRPSAQRLVSSDCALREAGHGGGMPIAQTTDHPVIATPGRRVVGAVTLPRSTRRPQLTVNEDYDLVGDEVALDESFDPNGVRLTQRALESFAAVHHCGRDIAEAELVGLMTLAAGDLEHHSRELAGGYHLLCFRGVSVVLSPDLSAAVSYRTRHRHLPSQVAGQDPGSYLSPEPSVETPRWRAQ